MATYSVLLLFIAIGFSSKQVSGYYCDSDRCGIDEYCCGVNTCCTSYAAWQLWYFWCGIIFFIFLLSACACFCRYRYYTMTIIDHKGANPYARLEHRVGNQYPSVQVPDGQYGEYPHHFNQGTAPKYVQGYPPPPYAPTTTTTEKDPNYCR